MDWGVIMSAFTVGGMLMLVFAQPRDVKYQSFGEYEVMPAIEPKDEKVVELKKAA